MLRILGFKSYTPWYKIESIHNTGSTIVTALLTTLWVFNLEWFKQILQAANATTFLHVVAFGILFIFLTHLARLHFLTACVVGVGFSLALMEGWSTTL